MDFAINKFKGMGAAGFIQVGTSRLIGYRHRFEQFLVQEFRMCFCWGENHLLKMTTAMRDVRSHQGARDGAILYCECRDAILSHMSNQSHIRLHRVYETIGRCDDMNPKPSTETLGGVGQNDDRALRCSTWCDDPVSEF